MAIEKKLTHTTVSEIETVAVDIPERPDLVFVYKRRPRGKSFDTILMKRDVYEKATKPKDLVKYQPPGHMYCSVIPSDLFESFISGQFTIGVRSNYVATYGQQFDENFKILHIDTLSRPVRYFDANLNEINSNPTFDVDEEHFDVDKFLEQEKDNTNVIVVPPFKDSPKPFSEYTGANRKVFKRLRISFTLSDEMYKEFRKLDENHQWNFIKANTVIGKYERV